MQEHAGGFEGLEVRAHLEEMGGYGGAPGKAGRVSGIDAKRGHWHRGTGALGRRQMEMCLKTNGPMLCENEDAPTHLVPACGSR